MNRIILMGRLTKDAELTYTQSNNTAVCKYSLAVERKFVKQGEERQADFINCVSWGKTAEFVSKYFAKGLRVAVEGRIQTRSWEDAEGKKHYATEVIAENVYFADGKREGNNNSSSTGEFNGVDDPDNMDELPF